MNTLYRCYLLHALSSLLGDEDELVHAELRLLHVQMFVETVAIAPLGHDLEVGLRQAAHEQQYITVSRFPVVRKIHQTGSVSWFLLK